MHPSDPWKAIRAWAQVSGAALETREDALKEVERCLDVIYARPRSLLAATAIGEAVIWLTVAAEVADVSIETCISKALLKKMKEL